MLFLTPGRSDPDDPRRPAPEADGRLMRAWRRLTGHPDDRGMSTAEYAVGTLAAVAFAGVLYAVVSSSATRSLITSVVQRALTTSF